MKSNKAVLVVLFLFAGFFFAAELAAAVELSPPSQLEFHIQKATAADGIPNLCGSGAYLQQLSDDKYGCFYSGFALPFAPSLGTYCAYVLQQTIGFAWLLAEDPSYTCPITARYATNGFDHAFCLWSFQLTSDIVDVYYQCDDFPSCQQIGYTFKYVSNSTKRE